MPRFPKTERLCAHAEIGELFRQAPQKTRVGPLQALFAPDASKPCRHVLISVPKKRFKRAVDRNRIRRCIRESYRFHKLAYPEPHGNLILIYVGDKIPTGHSLDEFLQKILQRLCAASS